MKVKKSELLSVLGKVKPGLARREFIEQATHFIFTDNEVTTFNDMVCIMHPFKCDLTFSVKGEEFYKVISGLSEEDVDLSLKDDTIVIKTKSTKAALSTIVGEAAKVEGYIKGIKADISAKNFWSTLPKEFISGVYLCAFSASKDLSTGLKACVAAKDGSIYSTDGVRASMYMLDKDIYELLIPAKDALELCKYKVEDYGISDNWGHFRTKDGIVFNCKLMKGDYPYDKINKIFHDTESALSFPEELKEVITSITILAEGDIDINKMVFITISSNTLTVKAEKERGWIEKTIPIKYNSDDLSFSINPIFFAQILQYATGFVKIDNLAQFESNNFFHIMALPKEN